MVFRIACSSDGRVVSANERALKAGFKTGDLLQSYLRDFVSKRTWMQLMAEINQQPIIIPSESPVIITAREIFVDDEENTNFPPTFTNYSLTIHAPQASVLCECYYYECTESNSCENAGLAACNEQQDSLGGQRYIQLIGVTSHQPYYTAAHLNQVKERQYLYDIENLDYNLNAVIASDMNGKIIYANDTVTDLYGWRPHEIIGRNVVETMSSDLDRERGDQIWKALVKGMSWAGDFICKHRDGTDVPTRTTDYPIFNSDNKLVGIVGVSCRVEGPLPPPLNSTGLSSAESSLVSNTTDVDVGNCGGGGDNSNNSKQQPQQTQKQLLQVPPSGLDSPPLSKSPRLLPGATNSSLTHSEHTNNNSSYSLLESAQQQGSMSMSAAVLLLGRNCASAETGDGCADFVIRWYNKSLADNFRLPDVPPIQASVDYRPADPQRIIGQDPLLVPALKFSQWPAGKIVNYHGRPLNVQQIDLPSEQCRLYLLSDAMLQQRLEVSLKAAADTAEKEAFKTDFITTMSHEMRTPLHGIIGECENLEWLINSSSHEQIPASFQSTVLESIRIINGSSKIQLQLVNNVLEWQKLAANKVVVDRLNFDLRQTIQSVVHGFRCLLRIRGLCVDVDVADSVPSLIRTDQLKIQQILINYLSNAVKYTSENTRIMVKAERSPFSIDTSSAVVIPPPSPTSGTNMIGILVQDQGLGVVGEEQQEKLFQRFAQLANSSQANGSGIGLSVCRQLAEMLGGRVWYEHPAKFWCSFSYEEPVLVGNNNFEGFSATTKSLVESELISPLSSTLSIDRQIFGGWKRQKIEVTVDDFNGNRVEMESRVTSGQTGEVVSPQRRKSSVSKDTGTSVALQWSPVLIVEDNVINQRVLVKMLQKLGFRRSDIDVSNDGLQALEATAQKKYPLILMDVSMPNMDGIQATAELRRRLCTSRIVGISANAMAEHANAGISAGMDGFLVKPVQSADIWQFMSSNR